MKMLAQHAPVVHADERDCAEQLPSDLPGENDITRALFHLHDEGEALEVVDGERVVYLMPWCARNGGVAAFEQHVEAYDGYPIELEADEVRRLLERAHARVVPVMATPAGQLSQREGGPHVSWHARVRWSERVSSTTDPAPEIREAYQQGVSVGVGRGHGRYHAPKNVVLCAASGHDEAVITTVIQPDDVQEEFGADHLKECPSCDEIYDPGDRASCGCCGAPVCPWCDDSLA